MHFCTCFVLLPRAHLCSSCFSAIITATREMVGTWKGNFAWMRCHSPNGRVDTSSVKYKVKAVQRDQDLSPKDISIAPISLWWGTLRGPQTSWVQLSHIWQFYISWLKHWWCSNVRQRHGAEQLLRNAVLQGRGAKQEQSLWQDLLPSVLLLDAA